MGRGISSIIDRHPSTWCSGVGPKKNQLDAGQKAQEQADAEARGILKVCDQNMITQHIPRCALLLLKTIPAKKCSPEMQERLKARIAPLEAKVKFDQSEEGQLLGAVKDAENRMWLAQSRCTTQYARSVIGPRVHGCAGTKHTNAVRGTRAMYEVRYNNAVAEYEAAKAEYQQWKANHPSSK